MKHCAFSCAFLGPCLRSFLLDLKHKCSLKYLLGKAWRDGCLTWMCLYSKCHPQKAFGLSQSGQHTGWSGGSIPRTWAPVMNLTDVPLVLFAIPQPCKADVSVNNPSTAESVAVEKHAVWTTWNWKAIFLLWYSEIVRFLFWNWMKLYLRIVNICNITYFNIFKYEVFGWMPDPELKLIVCMLSTLLAVSETYQQPKAAGHQLN